MFLLATCAAVLAPGRSEAAPMWTDLATVKKDATTIVIGTVVPSQTDIVFDVDKVIRGNAKTGKMTLKESPDGHVFVDTGVRVIAFVDGSGAFRWVGSRIAGGTIENGVIQLSGFFDWNAHVVSPGIMTLAQLEKYLAGSALDQTFAATLSFMDSRGNLARSSRTFTVHTDHTANTQPQVRGLGFACLGSPHVDLDWGQFGVRLTDTCPQASGRWKSLELEGTYTGVDATGAITVDVTPRRPLVDEHQMDRFGADKTIVDVQRVLKVTLADGTVWTWRVDHELADPSGNVFKTGGFSATSRTNNGVTVTENGFDFHGPKVTIQPGEGPLGVVPMVRGGTITSCVLSRSGMADAKCTLTEDKPVFVK
jgi:hypothetical protein